MCSYVMNLSTQAKLPQVPSAINVAPSHTISRAYYPNTTKFNHIHLNSFLTIQIYPIKDYNFYIIFKIQ